MPPDEDDFRFGLEQAWMLIIADKLDAVRPGLGDISFEQGRGPVWTVTVVLNEQVWFTSAKMVAVESPPDQHEGDRIRVRTRVEFRGDDNGSYSAVYSSLLDPEVLLGVARPTGPDPRPHRLEVEPGGRVLKVEYLTDDGEWWYRPIE